MDGPHLKTLPHRMSKKTVRKHKGPKPLIPESPSPDLIEDVIREVLGNLTRLHAEFPARNLEELQASARILSNLSSSQQRIVKIKAEQAAIEASRSPVQSLTKERLAKIEELFFGM